MNPLIIAVLSNDRQSVHGLRRMSQQELDDLRASNPAEADRFRPLVNANPRPTEPCVARYTIRSEDVLREWQLRPSYLRTRMTARIPERRWEVETGGVLVAGMSVATDERSQRLIAEAARKAAEDSGFSTSWKTRSGGWVPLDAAKIVALRDAVFAHVQACFAREKTLSEALAAATDEQLPALAADVETFALPTED